MSSSFELSGFDEFEKKLQQIVRNMPEEKEKELKRLAFMLQGDIMLNTPVKSSTLKRSWTVGEVEDDSIEVGTNVEYAPHVEYGFQHDKGGFVKGKHMVEISLKQLEHRLPQELNRWMNEMLGDTKL